MNVDPAALSAAADSATDLLKALGHPRRLMILCQLVGGERSVGELASLMGVRDSTVSQHLALLRRDGVVQARRDGQTIWYAIASTPAQRVLETLSAIYCAAPPPRRTRV
ncbi:MAG: helix-turn-helix transcriptional regulator [Acetobacteraceae bacterium]|nr:helix-turn-helix transcriptional regulator [Acetobacteraceae bacterium]